MQMYSTRTSLYLDVYETARKLAVRNANPGIRSVADDIANDVVVALARKQKEQPGFVPDNPGAWATTAAGRRIIDYVRGFERDAGNVRASDSGVGSEQDRPGLLQGALPLDDEAAAIRLRALSGPRASVGAMNRVLLQQAMEQLDWTKREYLLMALVAEGVSYADIADRMGYKNADSVKTMVARLRREAKAVLGDAQDWLASPGPRGAAGGRGRRAED